MTETLATIRGTVQELNDMVRLTSIGYHEDVYLRVADNVVQTLMQTDGRSVVSYCTWQEDYFSGEVSGDAEGIIPVGGRGTDSRGFLDYMAFVDETDGTVEITLQGDPDTEKVAAPVAERWEAEGSLNASLRLPSSDDDFDQVPFDHPPRWTPDNEYASKACLTDEGQLPDDPDEWIVGPTVIETATDVIEPKIIEPAEFTDGVNFYPITIEDGEFKVDVEGAQKDDAIWGTVNAESVDGPDISREFSQATSSGQTSGFKCVFDTLQGNVTLQTAPVKDGGPVPPMTVVQADRADRTVRHLVGALAE